MEDLTENSYRIKKFMGHRKSNSVSLLWEGRNKVDKLLYQHTRSPSLEIGQRFSPMSSRPNTGKKSDTGLTKATKDSQINLYRTLRTHQASDKTDKSTSKLSSCFVVRKKSSILNAGHVKSSSLSINAKYKKDKSGKSIHAIFGEHTLRTMRDVMPVDEYSLSRKSASVVKLQASYSFIKATLETSSNTDNKLASQIMRNMLFNTENTFNDKFKKKRHNFSTMVKSKISGIGTSQIQNKMADSTKGTHESLPTEKAMEHKQHEQMRSDRHRKLIVKEKMQMSNFLKDPTLNSLIVKKIDDEINHDQSKKLVYLTRLEILEHRKANLRKTFDYFNTQRRVC